MRSNFNQAILSWSPPAINDPIVDGYEVFYDSHDGIRLSVDVGNTTMIILDSLDPELFYTAFIVAYGGDLPSTASSLVNITEGNRCLLLIKPLRIIIIIKAAISQCVFGSCIHCVCILYSCFN